MVEVVYAGAPPEPGEHQLVRGKREGKPHRPLAQSVVSKHRHRCDGEHLQKGENPGADIIVAVQVVVHRAVYPGDPDGHKQEQEAANAGQIDVSG